MFRGGAVGQAGCQLCRFARDARLKSLQKLYGPSKFGQERLRGDGVLSGKAGFKHILNLKKVPLSVRLRQRMERLASAPVGGVDLGEELTDYSVRLATRRSPRTGVLSFSGAGVVACVGLGGADQALLSRFDSGFESPCLLFLQEDEKRTWAERGRRFE